MNKATKRGEIILGSLFFPGDFYMNLGRFRFLALCDDCFLHNTRAALEDLEIFAREA